jgi:hypothetical protein
MKFAKAELQKKFWGKLFEKLRYNTNYIIEPTEKVILEKDVGLNKKFIGITLKKRIVIKQDNYTYSFRIELGHDKLYYGFPNTITNSNFGNLSDEIIIPFLSKNNEFQPKNQYWFGWKYIEPYLHLNYFLEDTPNVLFDENKLSDVLEKIVNSSFSYMEDFEKHLTK